MKMDEFENAIAAAVIRESGLPTGKVIWAKQTRARPARPFIALTLMDDQGNNQHSEQSIAVNPDWDPDTDTENLDALLLSNVDHPDLTVQLIAYSTEATGSSRAFNILERVRVKLGSDRATTDLGTVAVVSRGTVRDVSDVLENEYEGRAVLAITFRVADVNVENAGIIETVEVEDTIIRTSDTLVDDITLT